MIGKLNETAATASVPRRPTQKGVGKLVDSLKDVGKDDGSGETEQGARDGTLKNALGGASSGWGHKDRGLAVRQANDVQRCTG